MSVECCGSYRRGCSNSGDVDILITHKHKGQKVLNQLTSQFLRTKFVVAELSRGRNKFLGICKHPDYKNIET
eukprot:UN06243